MGRFGILVFVAATMWMLPGCTRSEGGTCYKLEDCDDGLICIGDDVRRCESCTTTSMCEYEGRCTPMQNTCVK